MRRFPARLFLGSVLALFLGAVAVPAQNLAEVRRIVAADGLAYDDFGSSVALSGDILAVGAPLDDYSANDQGAVSIYYRNRDGAEAWGLVKTIHAPEGLGGDRFGYSVAISGDFLVVGAVYDDEPGYSNTGSVYVFGRNEGGLENWGYVTRLTAGTDARSDDYFGVSVGVSGDIVVVGANGTDFPTNAMGAVYVFAKNAGGPGFWGRMKRIFASTPASGAEFGSAIGIVGDTCIVGAPNEPISGKGSQGAAYLFARNADGADAWGQIAKLTATDGAAGDRLGGAVAIASGWCVAGAFDDDPETTLRQGSAYLFRNTGTTAVFAKKLVAPDGLLDDDFGGAVAISDDRCIVGARYHDIITNANTGAAYVYDRAAGGTNNWGQVAKLVEFDIDAYDNFGYSVAVSGDLYAVGAYLDDIIAGTGSRTDQGSVRIFTALSAPISGKLATQTWTKANSPYFVTGQTTIDPGQMLTIEPGVEVRFLNDVQLIVNGSLRAIGTAIDSILFVPAIGSEWSGLRFSGNDTSLLAYARISGATADIQWPNNGGGGVYAYGIGTRVGIENSVIRDNRSTTDGGGVGVYNGARVTMTRCVVARNAVIGGSNRGGGVYSSGKLTLVNCTVTGNSAGSSPGVRNDDTLVMRNTIVRANTGSNELVTGSTFAIAWSNLPTTGIAGTSNIALDPGFLNAASGDWRLGALSPCANTGDPASPPDGDGSRADMGALGHGVPIAGSRANGPIPTQVWRKANGPYRIVGTVTLAAGDTLTIEPGVDVLLDADVPLVIQGMLRAVGAASDSIRFVPGFAAEWGGIRFSSTDSSAIAWARISGSHAKGSSPAYHGGAIRIHDGAARIGLDHVVISGNRADNYAGAIYMIGSGARLTMRDGIVRNNRAESNGGAFYIRDGARIFLERCLVTRNTSANNGGAFCLYSATADASGSTIAGNAATNGGAFYADYSTVRLTNTIAAGNSASEFAGYSLTGTFRYSVVIGGDGVGVVPIDPKFVDAANGDWRLQPTSPAINTADPASPADPDGSRADIGLFPTTNPPAVARANGVVATETWRKVDGPRHVVGAVTVPAGAVLTIEPGVDILFDADLPFVVQGALRAVGTSTDSIRFVPGMATEWGGIRISSTDSSAIAWARISGGHAEGSSPAYNGGAIRVHDGAAKIGLDHVVIAGNRADYYAGALYVIGSARVTMRDGIVRNNRATNAGGAFYVRDGARLVLERCLVARNASSEAGGAARMYSATMEAYGSTITENTATSGGTVYADYSTYRLVNSIAWGNGANDVAGYSTTYDLRYAILPGGDGTGVITIDPQFVDAAAGDWHVKATSPAINTGDPASAKDPDGTRADIGLFAVSNPTVAARANGSTLTDTWRKAGGARHVLGTVIVPVGDTLTIEPGVDVLFDVDAKILVKGRLIAAGTIADSIRFLPGVASEWGGIRFTDGDSSYLAYVRLSGGHAEGSNNELRSGGAIHASGSNTRVGIERSVIRDNIASYTGGGIATRDYARLTLTRCLVTRNRVDANPGYGGGLYFDNGWTSIYHCTIAGNRATDGGGINRYYGTVILRNSIVWANGAGEFTGYGTLSGSHTALDIAGGWDVTGAIWADPQFVDPGAYDWRLRSTSPCINRGLPTSPLDPDGTRADLGAFPFANPPAITEVSGTIATARWTKASSPYHVIGPLTVPAGEELAIDPGVDVLFDTDALVTVIGRLRAIGNAADSVRFIRGGAREWGGIRFSSGDSSALAWARISDVSSDAAGILHAREHRLGLTNVVVSNSRANGTGWGAVRAERTTITMRGCTIRKNAAIGINAAELATIDFRDGTIANNGDHGIQVDYNCSAILTNATITGNGQSGVFGYYATVRVADCTIAGNGRYGVETQYQRAGWRIERSVIAGNAWSGVYAYGGSPIAVASCTIAHNTGGASGGGIKASSAITMANSIVWGNGLPSIENAQNVTADYSDIQQSLSVHPGLGNLNILPGFADAIAGNFALAPGSPCIDAGDPAILDPDYTRLDIGALHRPSGQLNLVVASGPQTPGPGRVPAWKPDIVAWQVRFSAAPAETLSLRSLSIAGTGTIDHGTGIAAIKLARDTDGDGRYTVGVDPLLGAAQTFADSAGTVVFDLDLPVPASAAIDALVLVTFSADPPYGSTFGMRIAANADIVAQGARSGNAVTAYGAPLASPLRTVGSAAPTRLVMPKVVAGPGASITVPVVATFQDAYSVDLAFTVDPQTVVPASQFIVRHAFANTPGATVLWNRSQDTIRVSIAAEFASGAPVTLTGQTLVELAFVVRNDAALRRRPVAWVGYPRTNIGEDPVDSLFAGEIVTTHPYGDVSGTGGVTAYDASIILQYAVGIVTTIDVRLADVTGNGEVSSLDASHVLRRVVQPFHVFPVEEGILLKPAGGEPRLLSWVREDGAWTLVASDGTGIEAGEFTIALATAAPVTVTGGDAIAFNQEGTAVRVAFARVIPGDRLLIRIAGAGDVAPDIRDASLNEGLIPISIARPLAFALAQNAPNPFNPSTSIRFALPATGEVRLAVYGVDGRLVRVLISGRIDAGAHEVVWDGRDASGHEVASGTYVYRLTSDAGIATRKMVLVR